MRQLNDNEIRKLQSLIAMVSGLFDFLDGQQQQEEDATKETVPRKGRKPKIITVRCDDCLSHKTIKKSEFLDYVCEQCGSNNLSKT